MEYVFGFWWLIFPLMGFFFGAFGMWIGYKRQRDQLELMKTYAQQGKDPAEVARLLGMPVPPGATPGGGVGPGPTPVMGAWSHPWGPQWGPPWGWHSHWPYWGPYREWRRFITFASLAAGFGAAAYYDVLPGTVPAFSFVAILMAVFAIGALVSALMVTALSSKMDKHD